MMDTMNDDIVERLRTQNRFNGCPLFEQAADEIERLRAEVAQLQRGAFVLNVHERVYEAGKDRLIAWDSLDWESLSAGREATYVPPTYDHE